MLTDERSPEEPVLACNPQAIPAAERETHAATARELFGAALALRELPDGYALQLANDTATLLQAAHFIAHERLCCPFFHFTLELEADSGPLWLKLTGGPGVKAVLEAELGGLVSPQVLSQKGISDPSTLRSKSLLRNDVSPPR